MVSVFATYSGSLMGESQGQTTVTNAAILFDNDVNNIFYSALLYGYFFYTSTFTDLYIEGISKKDGGAVFANVDGDSVIKISCKVIF